MLDKLITLIIIDTNFILAYVIWVMNGYYASIRETLKMPEELTGAHGLAYTAGLLSGCGSGLCGSGCAVLPDGMG